MTILTLPVRTNANRMFKYPEKCPWCGKPIRCIKQDTIHYECGVKFDSNPVCGRKWLIEISGKENPLGIVLLDGKQRLMRNKPYGGSLGEHFRRRLSQFTGTPLNNVPMPMYCYCINNNLYDITAVWETPTKRPNTNYPSAVIYIEEPEKGKRTPLRTTYDMCRCSRLNQIENAKKILKEIQ